MENVGSGPRKMPVKPKENSGQASWKKAGRALLKMLEKDPEEMLERSHGKCWKGPVENVERPREKYGKASGKMPDRPWGKRLKD